MTALIIAGEMIFALPFHPQRFFRATMLEAFDISNTQLGDMFAVYGLTAMFSYFFGGPFADRYSARSLMVVSLVLTAFGGFYMATFPSVWEMSVLYGFWGVTNVFLFWAALIKATRNWGGVASQGIAFGILDGGRGLAAAVFAAIAVGILILYLPTETALVTDLDRRAGLRSIILYYSLITLLCAGIVWFLVPHVRGTVSEHRNPFVGIPEVIRRPLIWTQAAVIICAYCGMKGTDNYSLYAVQVLGMNEIDAARLATYGAYVRPVACVIAGLIADRYSSARSICVLFVMLVISYSVLAVVTPDTIALTLIYANVFVTFFAIFALRGIYYALLEETRTPKHLTGASVAVIAFIGYTPEIFFGPVTGRILDANPGVPGHLNYFAFLTAVSVVG
ncbi:MAG TPA: MFS transporter, partial [Acidobacteria bacterium]|nr:MFS transporter [Acidobacteriota bacterium]